jgi:RNA polymerase sigma-70 factor, ECF subfamily
MFLRLVRYIMQILPCESVVEANGVSGIVIWRSPRLGQVPNGFQTQRFLDLLARSAFFKLLAGSRGALNISRKNSEQDWSNWNIQYKRRFSRPFCARQSGANDPGAVESRYPMPSHLTDSAAGPFARARSSVAPEDARPRLEEEVVVLFDRFRAPLLRYLLSLGLGIADAEETIQEVFLSLFQHLHLGKSRTNLHGWLFRVAHNLALKRRHQALQDRESRADVGENECAREPGPNPEEQAANSQTQQRLRAVVQALPEQDRRCLTLRAEGLRYRDIAEILSMSLGAVALSLGRSLARIARVAER